MAKRGDSYQELVGAVQRALDPGAEVKVGVWVEGPDGRRDMDVSVRGFKDGKPNFVLIECKDWKEPVGIGVIDAFDSKRRDLGAEIAIVFSNSGFTADAERKAQRCDIQLASALRAGDAGVRVGITTPVRARKISVQNWVLNLFWNKQSTGPVEFQVLEIMYEGLPLVNWIRQDSLRLLHRYQEAQFIKAEYAFLAEHPFTIGANSYLLTGFGYRLECTTIWVTQTVREDVTLGFYDILRKRTTIPDQQAYTLGPFDRNAWVECAAAPVKEPEIEPGTLNLGLALFASVPGMDGFGVPDVDSIIRERAETVE